MRIGSRQVLRAALVVGVGLTLIGCDTIREAVGNGKEAPDEFAVVTKAPLIIPPDYNLRPPKPGAAPENQIEPTQDAQQSLFGADAATVANSMQGNLSPGEKLLLATAGAQNADPAIRQNLASDTNKSIQASSDGFTNSVLFWQKPSTPNDPSLDADAEAKRLAAKGDAANKSAENSTQKPASDEQKPASDEQKPASNDQKPTSDDQTSVQKEKKSGGWFDWL
jgi:hypothetical protein